MDYWIVLYAVLGGLGLLAAAAVVGFVVLSRDINRRRRRVLPR